MNTGKYNFIKRQSAWRRVNATGETASLGDVVSMLEIEPMKVSRLRARKSYYVDVLSHRERD
jgi:hypothetical protein